LDGAFVLGMAGKPKVFYRFYRKMLPAGNMMRRILRAMACVLLGGSITHLSATSIPPVKAEDLFHQADLVAVVRIVSGDSEHYAQTVYKAEVVMAFKGVAPGQTVFWGPNVGYGIGNEYLVFLRRSEGIAPGQNAEGLGYGNITSFYLVMYEGYSVMPAGYNCVFDGKEPAEQCDYSIQLNPEQIILPKRIRTFPEGPTDAVTNYKKWVRRGHLVSFLQIVSLKQAAR
jgi:hypothetical protein